MSKRPADDLLIAELEAVEKDLARIKVLLPLVRHHRLRNSGPPVKSMECTRPEAVVKVPESSPEPKDLRALLFLFDTLKRWRIVRRQLAERLPALDAKLDGRKLEEEAPVGSRPVVESVCICCGNVAAQLRRGLCPADYQAWYRAGCPDVGIWIPSRRRDLEAA